jgi:hypothetical protein
MLKKFILISLCLLTINLNVFAQSNEKKNYRDLSQTISLSEFNRRVERGIELLKTKSLSEISDTDHINIMMCLNTIIMTHKNDSLEPLFNSGRYTELEKIVIEKGYEEGIIKVYPNPTFNRGMGYYFPKLKMELYGTPMPYAVFKVL